MRLFSLLLVVLIALVQAELWFGSGGFPRVIGLRGELATQDAHNEKLRDTNARLAAEMADLRNGLEMVEERARIELDMIREGEILVAGIQPVPPAAAAAAAPPSPAAQPAASR